MLERKWSCSSGYHNNNHGDCLSDLYVPWKGILNVIYKKKLIQKAGKNQYLYMRVCISSLWTLLKNITSHTGIYMLFVTMVLLRNILKATCISTSRSKQRLQSTVHASTQRRHTCHQLNHWVHSKSRIIVYIRSWVWSLFFGGTGCYKSNGAMSLCSVP